MNDLGFENPWLLSALLLSLPPLWRSGVKPTRHACLSLLPPDALSGWLDWLLRILPAAAIALATLGAAGMHLKQQKIARLAHGAHMVILLDRSKSMDNSFAGQTPSDGEQSKASAARSLLNKLVDQRRRDLIGFAAYSTSALPILPLTENKQALHAAIDATASPALAYTNISKGLALALAYFDQKPTAGSRIVLLVSDGAAVIDPDSEAALRQLFKRTQVRLYWLFLRTENNPGIFSTPEDNRDDNPQAMPERYLHMFFTSLGIPYQAYEAEDANAMRQAIADFDRLEQFPLPYFETIPRQDLSGVCFTAMSISISLLLGLKWLEGRK